MKRSIVCLACLVVAVGCTTIKPSPTPPGSVPPPTGAPPIASPQGAVPPPQAPAAVTRSPQTGGAAAAPAVVADPYRTYRGQGSPRVAVYVTRKYGSRINDWQGGTQIVGRHQRTKTSGDEVKTTEQSGQLGVFRPAGPDQPAQTRAARRLERGLVNHLVGKAVIVVDPDMILREEAAKHRDVDATDVIMLSREMVETYALNNNVSLLFTVDIERSGDNCGTIEALAQIKEMKSGTILASLSTTELDLEPKDVWIAGDNGYEKSTETRKVTCDEVATMMADACMARLDPWAN